MNLKKQLKEKAKALEPMLHIGKNGLTDGVIAEIGNMLKKKKLVKIKLLKSFLKSKDKKSAAKEIADKTNSELIDRVGFIIVLYKK